MSKRKTKEKDRIVLSRKAQTSEPQCCCSRGKSSTSVRCNKNRVTIFGQLGQSENDKYTLEYAAKLNDTSISPDLFTEYYNISDDQGNSEQKEVTSHAVQVNIRECWEYSEKRLIANNDQAVQCNFERLSLVPDNYNVDGTENRSVLEKCNSPVIVISVYPRPDIKINTDKVLRKSNPNSRKNTSNLAMVENTKTAKEKRDISQNRRSKSRSASPVVKKINKNKTEDNILHTQNAKRLKNKNSSNLFKTNRKIIKSEPQNVKESYTTEIKQTLIDNFIKSMESEDDNYAKFLLSVPRSTASKITIDLNKNKQPYYGVPLNINKKEANENQKHYIKSPNKAMTAKNLSTASNKNISDKQSVPKTKFSKMITNSNHSKFEQLKPRDSLVVNHSRELRRSEIKASFQNNISREKSGTKKHYRGDDCPIDDPNIRDKEIQRLLGITKKQATRSAKPSESYLEPNGFKCSKTIIVSVKRKRQPRSSFTLRDDVEESYQLPDKNVIWHNTLINGVSLPSTTLNTTNKISHKVKSHSHHIDKAIKIIPRQLRNTNFDYLNSELPTNQSKLVCDYDFFQAQKPYKYRRNKLPYYKLHHKSTMTSKNKHVDNYGKRKINMSLLVAGNVKVKEIYKKQLCFDRKIQTENKNLEKFAQTEKTLCNRKRFKIPRDSENYEKKKTTNKLLRIDSERIINQDKEICHRSTVSAVDVSRNYDFPLESKTPKSYLNQKGDGLDLNKQVDHVNSLYVIYKDKGRKRSVTPNLGTSFLSISVISCKNTHSKLNKRRKTFLSHILSCVMKKMQRKSDIPNTGRLKTISTANTIGSYYINTSLAPWDMSSSIYDTSASYYSRHSFYGMTKIKRGFFSSVCNFFARRKIHKEVIKNNK